MTKNDASMAQLVVSVEFADATTAGRFERYLKTGTGRAFTKRHFGGERA